MNWFVELYAEAALMRRVLSADIGILPRPPPDLPPDLKPALPLVHCLVLCVSAGVFICIGSISIGMYVAGGWRSLRGNNYVVIRLGAIGAHTRRFFI